MFDEERRDLLYSISRTGIGKERDKGNKGDKKKKKKKKSFIEESHISNLHTHTHTRKNEVCRVRHHLKSHDNRGGVGVASSGGALKTDCQQH